MSWRTLLTLTFAISKVWGCSCVTSGTACDALKGTPIVFVGRVIQDSGEGYGNGPGRVGVEEILHGLPPATKEVEIETASGSSCYYRLQKDERYVIFTANRDGRMGIAGCSWTFNVRGNEALLAALREAERGGDPRLVGHVRRMTGAYSSEQGPAGVRVVADGNGKKFEAFTSSGGQFEFRGLAPGSYDLRVTSAGWVEAEERMWPREAPVVAKQACQIRTLKVWPDGQISGVVRSESGDAVADVTVQAFVFNQRGALDTSPLREAKTDAQGRYTIHGLVAGSYVVGVNGEKYKDRSPYRPAFFGSDARDAATRIEIDEGGSQSGIDLRLGTPRRPATVTIEAVDEDGKPAEIGSVGVYDVNRGQRGFTMGDEKTPGIVRLSLFQGETRRFEVSKFTRFGQFEGETDFILINAPDLHLRIVVRKVNRDPRN